MAKLNHYDGTGTKVIRTSEHKSPEAQRAAIRRARAKREIVCWAGDRKATDPPTCHH